MGQEYSTILRVNLRTARKSVHYEMSCLYGASSLGRALGVPSLISSNHASTEVISLPAVILVMTFSRPSELPKAEKVT